MCQLPCRLEELGERRAGLLARAKVTEKEREGLEGAKAAAEAYRDKEAQCFDSRATILQLFIRDGQVSSLHDLHSCALLGVVHGTMYDLPALLVDSALDKESNALRQVQRQVKQGCCRQVKERDKSLLPCNILHTRQYFSHQTATLRSTCC